MCELYVNSAIVHILIWILIVHISCQVCLVCTAAEFFLVTYGMQLHNQILVKATLVIMEEHVLLRALVSFALVLMTTPGKDVNNVCMFWHNIL